MTLRLLFFILFSTSVYAQSVKTDTLIFATYRYSDNNRIKNIRPFAEWFGANLKVAVKVRSFDSVHDLVDAIQMKKVDIVFINTFGYLLSREHSDQYKIAAALSLPENARSTYQTAIVSSVASNIRSLENLKGMAGKYSLSLVNPGSTSGNLIPRLQFAQLGITEPEKFFTSITYTKNHTLTLREIVDGKADIGAFGSEEFYKAQQADKELRRKVNLLWESQPIPLGPVLFRSDLQEEISSRLIESLLSLHRENPAALEAIKSGWTEAIPANKFQVVDEHYYTDIIKNDPVTGMNIIRAFAR